MVAVNELIVTKYVVQKLTITSVEEVGFSMTGTPKALSLHAASDGQHAPQQQQASDVRL